MDSLPVPQAAGVPEVTVKFIPALAAPPAITTTFPVEAPVGTLTTMLVALQAMGVAAVPLKVTELFESCEAPKPVPVIVTAAPTIPEVGARLVIAVVVLPEPEPLPPQPARPASKIAVKIAKHTPQLLDVRARLLAQAVFSKTG
jgi:hypothetical protein